MFLQDYLRVITAQEIFVLLLETVFKVGLQMKLVFLKTLGYLNRFCTYFYKKTTEYVNHKYLGLKKNTA